MADDRGTSRRAAGRPAPDGGWALTLGSVSGIPIRLHFTFLLLLAWFFFVGSGADRILGVLYVIGIFTCVVLHELGHSLVAQRYGIPIREIILYPIGGVARIERLPKPPQEFWIALAGPAVNVVIAGVLFIVLTATGRLTSLGDAVQLGGASFWTRLLIVNISLVAFNMIPALPMDGGRVLRALLAMRLGELRATEIAASIGQVIAVGFGVLGLWNPMLFLIAIFVYLAAGQEAAMYRSKAMVEGLTVREAMLTDFRTLPVGATLREAADRLLETSQADFPVIHGDEVIGLLSRQALLKGLAEHGPSAYVTGEMDREFLSVSPGDDLQETAEEMQSAGGACALVMEQGALLGLLTMENLAEFLIIRQLLRRTDRNV